MHATKETTPVTVGRLLLEARTAFGGAGIADAELEAGWLCGDALGLDRQALFRRRQTPLSAARVQRVRGLIARRVNGEPLQYVMGSAEFYGLLLRCGPGVLIPRPETEGLVELALTALARCGAGRSHRDAGVPAFCDVCTGSGAVALAVAAELAGRCEVWATDISPAALRYARLNRRRLGLRLLHFCEGDLFAPLPCHLTFDVITANPPYISPADYAQLPEEVRAFEPRLALYAEDQGLAILRRLVEAAPARLKPDGWLFCEIGSDQRVAALELLGRNGYRHTEVRKDTFGNWRFAMGQRPAEP